MSTRTVTANTLLAEALADHEIADRVIAVTIKVWECAECDDTHVSIEVFDRKDGRGIGFDVAIPADSEPTIVGARELWDHAAEMLAEASDITDAEDAKPKPPVLAADTFGLRRGRGL